MSNRGEIDATASRIANGCLAAAVLFGDESPRLNVLDFIAGSLEADLARLTRLLDRRVRPLGPKQRMRMRCRLLGAFDQLQASRAAFRERNRTGR